MPEEITRESYRAALQRAVDEKGSEYAYARNLDAESPGVTCRYIEKDGSLGCIHGHALTYLGYSGMEEGRGVWAILSTLGVDDVPLKNAALDAQAVQDGGRSWGEALEVFDKTLAAGV